MLGSGGWWEGWGRWIAGKLLSWWWVVNGHTATLPKKAYSRLIKQHRKSPQIATSSPWQCNFSRCSDPQVYHGETSWLGSLSGSGYPTVCHSCRQSWLDLCHISATLPLTETVTCWHSDTYRFSTSCILSKISWHSDTVTQCHIPICP